MSVSYDKLWLLLFQRKIKRSDLKDRLGFTSNVIANMGKNRYVSLEIIEKICIELNCEISDIVEIIKEES